MTPLISRKPKRLFVFGCSFTKWLWTGWPEIVANFLDVPYWNFGIPGGGNQSIMIRLAQAHNIYNINSDDLVIICWTNVSREDRWTSKANDWESMGNVFSTNPVWGSQWSDRWADSTYYALRDLSAISLARDSLERWGCQHHFLSMCDIIDNIDEQYTHSLEADTRNRLATIFSKELNLIAPSYYKVLWNNDISKNKLIQDQLSVHHRFIDGHPTPLEHLEYLNCIWPGIKDSQLSTVLPIHETWKNLLKTAYDQRRGKLFGKCWVQDYLTADEKLELLTLTRIRSPEPIDSDLF